MIYLGDIPMLNAARFPEMEAVVFEETRLDWSEFNARINRLANALERLGFETGDHLAILLENCHQYMEIYYALAKAGMVAVPLNYRLTDGELSHIIGHSNSVGLFVGDRFVDRVAGLRPGLDKVRRYVSVESPADGMDYYEEFAGSGDASEPDWERLDENDMVILMYTGGTTGLPKGVMISHRNILSALMGIAISQHSMLLPGMRTLFALPFFHIANWQPLFFQMMGASVVISRTANPETIVRLIREEMTIAVNLVPTLYAGMLEIPGIEKMNLAHVMYFSVAGAPMAPETFKRCVDLFGLKVGKGYGLTEAASAVSSLEPKDFALEGDEKLVRRGKSVGRATVNARVKIRRPDGTECGPGESGEITVFGKNVMLGYWKNPELTAEALRDGWLWTGDIGYKDEDQFIYLVDRRSEMIITGGENVYPSEVEDVLYMHPAVMEAAVIGVPDAKWGEAVKAVVALKPDATASAEELLAFCREHIAGYKVPKSVDFMDELPKTPIGKILRRTLKDGYAAG